MSSDDVVVQAFTELAPHYSSVMERELQQLWGVGYTELLNHLVALIPHASSVRLLDVATGTAHIPAVALQRATVADAVGIDITPAMLKAAQSTLAQDGTAQQTRLACASATCLPFPSGSFSVITCALATHHMDVAAALAEMRRVLRSGGHLLLLDVGALPVWRTAVGRAAIHWALLLYGWAHRSNRAKAEAGAVPNLRTTEEWQSLLRNSGFVHVELVHTWAPRRMWYPQALLYRAAAA